MGVDLLLDIFDSLWRHRNIAAKEVSRPVTGVRVESSGKVAELGRRCRCAPNGARRVPGRPEAPAAITLSAGIHCV